MNKNSTNPQKIHHGRNIKRFREMFGMKQEALAIELGSKWSQKKVSTLERMEFVNAQISAAIAKIFRIPVGIIENFTEENAIKYFNTYKEYYSNHGIQLPNCSFNPFDKLMEVVEENRKLYERLLISESAKG